jgi:hypothetical protein
MPANASRRAHVVGRLHDLRKHRSEITGEGRVELQRQVIVDLPCQLPSLRRLTSCGEIVKVNPDGSPPPVNTTGATVIDGPGVAAASTIGVGLTALAGAGAAAERTCQPSPAGGASFDWLGSTAADASRETPVTTSAMRSWAIIRIGRSVGMVICIGMISG